MRCRAAIKCGSHRVEQFYGEVCSFTEDSDLARLIEQLLENRLSRPQYVGVLTEACHVARRVPAILRSAADRVRDTELASYLRSCALEEEGRCEHVCVDLTNLGVPVGEPGESARRLTDLVLQIVGTHPAHEVLGVLEVFYRTRTGIDPERLVPDGVGSATRFLDDLADPDGHCVRRVRRQIASLPLHEQSEVARSADEFERLFVDFLVDASTPMSQTDADRHVAAELATSGLVFDVATDISQVMSSWRMVYKSYLQSGLIPPNPQRIHTAHQAIGRNTAVIVGSIRGVVVTTLSAFIGSNGPGSLPLERVYGAELMKLRRAGRRLMEVGLFADRRRNLARTAQILFQLMRFAFHYGRASDITDFVIGIHPRHARFYLRSFGFQEFGPVQQYPAVNNNPVVLLRGDFEVEMSKSPLHPALQFFVDHPVASSQFDRRFSFDPADIAGTPIETFLGAHQDTAPLHRAG